MISPIPSTAPVRATNLPSTPPAELPQADDVRAGPDPEGIRVTLSELGKSKSGASQRKSAIDESNLPELIKQILKTIRELKLQLDQKLAELQAVMGDGALAPEEKQSRLQALQSELATLSGALSSAYSSLSKAMRDMQLSDTDIQTALSLLT